jgi:hypothetical protein
MSLLLAMGLVYQGSRPFLGGDGYLLWPNDSKGLGHMDRRRSFGVIAYPDSIHLFVNLHDLRWVSRPINEMIHRYRHAHEKARLFLHLVYRGIPPNLDQGLGKDWPLIAIPSVIAEWHERPRSDKEPGEDPDVQFDHVRFFRPLSGTETRTIQFDNPKSWVQWKVAFDKVKDAIDALNGTSLAASPFRCVDKSWPRWGPRQVSKGGPGDGSAAPLGMAIKSMNHAPDQEQAEQAKGGKPKAAITPGYPAHEQLGRNVQVTRTHNTGRDAPSIGPSGGRGRALLAEVQAWRRRILARPMNGTVPDYSGIDAEELDRAIRLLGG